jgi:hypothetical protein
MAEGEPMKIGYAAGTDVPVERSRAEIDAVLTKNGAGSVAILNDEEKHIAMFAFTIRGARFRVELPLPSVADVTPVKGKEPGGWWSWGADRRAQYVNGKLAQARRERWRQMLLLLKAKLEIVRMGLSTVEREFMADMVLPSGRTAFVALADALAKGLEPGDTPRQLGSGT